MKLTVIGLGYLGATHAVAMAKLGHEVIGIEPDPRKLALLESGTVPFHEPGLQQALAEVLRLGNLSFQAGHDEITKQAAAHFICVGTPQTKESNRADTSYVFAAANELAQFINHDSVVIGKSTVPVGTASQLQKTMAEVAGFDVHLVWNPEFLREGTALEDSLNPDRIVFGATDNFGIEVCKKIYAQPISVGTPVIEVDLATAELVKVAANAFLATKISFINAMAEVAEVAGADAVALAKAIGHDERIGNKFLRTGIGFGGGCLPKDIRGFIARAEELGVGNAVDFLRDVDSINLRRRDKVVLLAQELLGDLSGKKILMLGISFKPDSDDLRDSPALEITQRLAKAGANVVVHDPISLPALRERDASLSQEQDLNKAAVGADLVILGTEWREYRELEPGQLSGLVARRLVIDGRNVLDVTKWQADGWEIHALGRNIKNG